MVRATEDVDIVPDPAPANLDALGNVLVTLNARLVSDPARALSIRRFAPLSIADAISR